MDFDFLKTFFGVTVLGVFSEGAFVVNKKINFMKVRKIKRILQNSKFNVQK